MINIDSALTATFPTVKMSSNIYNLGQTISLQVVQDNFSVDKVEKIINNNPHTVVKWKDGTITVVKCQDGDTYSFEAGIALCFMKKACGNDGKFNKVFRKFCTKQ